jgi:uncharacterized protein (DUF697 family)
MHLNNLSDSFEQTIKNTDLHSVTSNLAEVALDSVLNDGLLKDIPIIGSILGAGKTVVAIKEQLFLKKLICFLSETAEVAAEQRQKVITHIEQDEKYNIKVGEKLLFIIERCDDYEKATFVSKLFNAFLKETITYSEFLRCTSILERLYIEDLKEFIISDWLQLDIDEAQDILNSGLVYLQPPVISVEDQWDHKETDKYVVSGSELTVYISTEGNIIREVFST